MGRVQLKEHMRGSCLIHHPCAGAERRARVSLSQGERLATRQCLHKVTVLGKIPSPGPVCGLVCGCWDMLARPLGSKVKGLCHSRHMAHKGLSGEPHGRSPGLRAWLCGCSVLASSSWWDMRSVAVVQAVSCIGSSVLPFFAQHVCLLQPCASLSQRRRCISPISGGSRTSHKHVLLIGRLLGEVATSSETRAYPLSQVLRK